MTSVEETTDTSGRIPFWVITYRVPESVADDGVVTYYLPKAALEHRVAEYGLDSVEEALEIALYEPVLGPHQAAGELDMLTPALLRPPEARAQVDQQIAICKENYGVVVTAPSAPPDARVSRATSAARDPLRVIREQTRIDPIRTAALRVELDRIRMTYQRTQEATRG
ncbi:hypothetical protein [Planomonospora parontospora]|uniref:hypothetical protein n=1 Tax=Planomonospora parontospora TaxID=58119 RepID=UPI001784DDFE|nr:hypothetical protein [Planomonospora parontospora]